MCTLAGMTMYTLTSVHTFFSGYRKKKQSKDECECLNKSKTRWN